MSRDIPQARSDLAWEFTGIRVQILADRSEAVSHRISLRLGMKVSTRPLELVLPGGEGSLVS